MLYLLKSKTTSVFNFTILLLFILIVFLAYFRSTIQRNTSIYDINETNLTGYIIDYQVKTDKITYTIMTTKDKKKEKILATKYLNQSTKIPNITLGDSITLKGKLKLPSKNTIPNTFNYQEYLYHKEIYYLFTIEDITLLKKNTNPYYQVQNLLYKRTKSLDDTGYLTMLIYGKKEIDQDSYETLANLGVIHLFAISGLHLQIFTLLLEHLLKKLKVLPHIKTLLIIIFLTLYAALINFPASILRALTLYIFMHLLPIIFKQKIDLPTYQVLILSTSFLLLINPHFLYDIGFLYSSLCTFGLLYFNDQTKNKILKALKTTLIATLWSLPISISLNYTYNLLSPIYNLIYVPFISIIFYPCCLLTFIFPFLLPLLKVLITLLELLTFLFSQISLNIIFPKMSILVIIIYYISIYLLSKYQNINCYLITTLILCLYPLKYNYITSLNIYYLDVNQGDCSLIISPKKKDVTMIDTGGLTRDINNYTIKNIIRFMHSLNIKKIDNLLISHGDYDHIGNATYLVDNFKIKNVYFNYDDYDELEESLKLKLEQKKINYYKGLKSLKTLYYTFAFLNSDIYDNENDNSLVTYFKYLDYTFLYMGDASSTRETNIIKKYNLEKITILKVGHHGSKTSSSKEFINEINPKYSIISVGKNNRYGHPNKETLSVLSSSNVYRTDLMGTIEVEIDKRGYQIKNYEP